MTIHTCNLLILGDSQWSMADFAGIIQHSNIGYSLPSLCLGRSRIPFTTNSAILFSRLNVILRSLNLWAFEILRSNTDFLSLSASFIENVISSLLGSDRSATLDLVKLHPRFCMAILKVGPISSNNFQACSLFRQRERRIGHLIWWRTS